MKPNIDLKNEGVKNLINHSQSKVKKALNVPQKVESAVMPIFHLFDYKSKPELIGSGVLVNIKTEYFIFSASHVFDHIEHHQILIHGGTENKLLSISGERFSSARGKSGTHQDDNIDASVFHIQSPITNTLKEASITLEDFDLYHKSDDSMYIASGFRVKKSKRKGNCIYSEREGFCSGEINTMTYEHMKIDSNYHIALAYDDQLLVDKKWQISPSPKGFSGGAIIKVDGVKLFKDDSTNPKQLLSGIIIEHHRGKNKETGILLGTKIGVHLSLIHKFLPTLMDDLLPDI